MAMLLFWVKRDADNQHGKRQKLNSLVVHSRNVIFFFFFFAACSEINALHKSFFQDFITLTENHLCLFIIHFCCITLNRAVNFQFPACFARDWIGSVNLSVVLCVSEKDEERGILLVFNVVVM